jgi:hypothetical protein
MRCLAVLAVLLLASCVAGGPAAGPDVNPLATEAIETTAIDAPATTGAATPAEVSATAVPPNPQAPPETSGETDEAAPVLPGPTEEVAAPPPASPEEARCIRSGGTWATAGQSGAKACVKLTRDGGKACTRQSQCEGFCLARSGTCAPITPMFGCNDILQDDGREVTLCLD